MAVVCNLYHEVSALCVWCEQPPAGRGVELARGDDGKRRYLCQRCVDAGVDSETDQRRCDYHTLILPFPGLAYTQCREPAQDKAPQHCYDGAAPRVRAS